MHALRAANRKTAVRFVTVAASLGAKRVLVVPVLVQPLPRYGVVVVAYSPAAPIATIPTRLIAKCIVRAYARFCRSLLAMIASQSSNPLRLRHPRLAWLHKNSRRLVSTPY